MADAAGPVPDAASSAPDPTDPLTHDAEGADAVDDRPRFVRCVVGGRALLVGVDAVLEVLVPGPITRLPGSAEAIAGVTSVRGRIVAVVDPRRTLGSGDALGTDPGAESDRGRFLVVATPAGPVALMVDRVDAVVASVPDAGTAASGDGPGDGPSAPIVVATAPIDDATLPVIDPVAVVASIAAPRDPIEHHDGRPPALTTAPTGTGPG